MKRHRKESRPGLQVLTYKQTTIYNNPSQGRGYARTFKNLKAITELGHKVTIVAVWERMNTEEWCNSDCIQHISDLNIEIATTPWNHILNTRLGTFDMVIVSRVNTFIVIHEALSEAYKRRPFCIVYDSEALIYRRNEMLFELLSNGVAEFPGAKHIMAEPHIDLVLEQKKKNEISTLKMADTLIAVSHNEAEEMERLLPDTNIYVVGHAMDARTVNSGKGYMEREGILYVASFDNEMYYNGDAIWYFLTEIYPLIIEGGNDPIPLTIAGRSIPEDLFEVVHNSPAISPYLTFVQSPPSIKEFFNKHRVFIAPHLYGAGIQYKISESIAMGVPVVMSELSASSFGLSEDSDITCVSTTPEKFKDCVIEVHNNQTKWESLREHVFEFIQETHNINTIRSTWSKIIGEGLETITSMGRTGLKFRNHILTEHFEYPTEMCPEGEETYIHYHPDVLQYILRGGLPSAFAHFSAFGKNEGRNYVCLDD